MNLFQWYETQFTFYVGVCLYIKIINNKTICMEYFWKEKLDCYNRCLILDFNFEAWYATKVSLLEFHPNPRSPLPTFLSSLLLIFWIYKHNISFAPIATLYALNKIFLFPKFTPYSFNKTFLFPKFTKNAYIY